MLICHERKLISISVPKTGSTSIHYALMAHLGMEFKFRDSDAHLYHLNAVDISTILGAERFSDYFSFGVVRNPYDRMVSLYHDFRDQRGIIRAPSFDEFVLRRFQPRWAGNIHFRPQTFFLCADGRTAVNAVYRFEDGLDSIMTRIGEIIGFSFSKIGHSRRSERDDWRQYYDRADVIDCIDSAFGDDFATFGYERISAN